MNISLSCLNKNYDDSVHKIHIEAKVLPLDMRRNIALLKLMFNSINKVEMNENLMLDNTYVKTRSSSQKNFRIIRPRYEWYRKAVVYQGKKKRWLDLPSSLKGVDNIGDFAKKINSHYVGEFKETGVVR